MSPPSGERSGVEWALAGGIGRIGRIGRIDRIDRMDGMDEGGLDGRGASAEACGSGA